MKDPIDDARDGVPPRRRLQHGASVSLALVKRRSSIIFLDQAVSSGGNILVLLLVGRWMSSADLSRFAVWQLVATSVMAVSRAAVFQVSLVLQRDHGAIQVPRRWATGSGVLAGIAVFIIDIVLHASGVGLPPFDAAILGAVTACVVLQDGLRYVELAEGRTWSVLSSDICWLVLSLMGLLLVWGTDEPVVPLLVWGSTALMSAALLVRRRRQGSYVLTLKQVWPLARWAGADVAMSGLSTLLPYGAASTSVDAGLTGTYRVLQSALGPLNVIHSAYSTSLAAGSADFADVNGAGALRVSVRRARNILVLLSCAYMIPAFTAIASFESIDVRVHWHIPVVLFLSGVLGAATTPYVAGSLVLKRQKVGTLIRAGVLVLSVAVSAWAADRQAPHRLSDPIGIIVLASSVVGFCGWSVAFRRASQQAQPSPPSPDVRPPSQSGATEPEGTMMSGGGQHVALPSTEEGPKDLRR